MDESSAAPLPPSVPSQPQVRPLQERSYCSISGKPARYFDPLTQTPYYSVKEFRILRQKYISYLKSFDCLKDDPRVKRLPDPPAARVIKQYTTRVPIPTTSVKTIAPPNFQIRVVQRNVNPATLRLQNVVTVRSALPRTITPTLFNPIGVHQVVGNIRTNSPATTFRIVPTNQLIANHVTLPNQSIILNSSQIITLNNHTISALPQLQAQVPQSPHPPQ